MTLLASHSLVGTGKSYPKPEQKWEYVKGSEADFIGHSDEWVSIWQDTTSSGPFFATKEGVAFSNMERFKLIAERRKVDNLQSRVNDANLGDALKEMFDTVQRPVHYNQSGIECIDAIAASMTPAEFQAYLKGNVQKYLWRYQHKNGVEDCRKAQWYLNRLVKELSK